MKRSAASHGSIQEIEESSSIAHGQLLGPDRLGTSSQTPSTVNTVKTTWHELGPSTGNQHRTPRARNSSVPVLSTGRSGDTCVVQSRDEAKGATTSHAQYLYTATAPGCSVPIAEDACSLASRPIEFIMCRPQGKATLSESNVFSSSGASSCSSETPTDVCLDDWTCDDDVGFELTSTGKDGQLDELVCACLETAWTIRLLYHDWIVSVLTAALNKLLGQTVCVIRCAPLAARCTMSCLAQEATLFR